MEEEKKEVFGGDQIDMEMESLEMRNTSSTWWCRYCC